jgi:hypothetical protein
MAVTFREVLPVGSTGKQLATPSGSDRSLPDRPGCDLRGGRSWAAEAVCSDRRQTLLTPPSAAADGAFAVAAGNGTIGTDSGVFQADPGGSPGLPASALGDVLTSGLASSLFGHPVAITRHAGRWAAVTAPYGAMTAFGGYPAGTEGSLPSSFS